MVMKGCEALPALLYEYMSIGSSNISDKSKLRDPNRRPVVFQWIGYVSTVDEILHGRAIFIAT